MLSYMVSTAFVGFSSGSEMWSESSVAIAIDTNTVIFWEYTHPQKDTTFLNEVVAKGAFLSRKYAHLFMPQYMPSRKQEALKKQHRAGEGTNK